MVNEYVHDMFCTHNFLMQGYLPYIIALEKTAACLIIFCA